METKGELTRGETVADWLDHWHRAAQTTVLMSVDMDAAFELYIERMQQLKLSPELLSSHINSTRPAKKACLED